MRSIKIAAAVAVLMAPVAHASSWTAITKGVNGTQIDVLTGTVKFAQMTDGEPQMQGVFREILRDHTILFMSIAVPWAECGLGYGQVYVFGIGASVPTWTYSVVTHGGSNISNVFDFLCEGGRWFIKHAHDKNT